MGKHSKDILDEIAAHNAIIAIESAKELREFIRGDQREHLMDVAVYRLRVLESPPDGPGAPKQGQQQGPMTRRSDDFKVGIQGAKTLDVPRSVIMGQDVIEEIDKAAFAHAQETERRAMEAESKKDAEAAAAPKSHITIDDVLASQRAEGRKV